MDYKEALKYIDLNLKGGCNPGLYRIEKLLELAGNPHKHLKAVHIAGTNGKGSVTAMVSSILKEGGYKVGTYISPHLHSVTERYMVNGESIAEETFAYYVSIIKDKIQRMAESGEEIPSQFEALTALAFMYFKDVGIDIGVIEVGLGGRYDATNVLDSIISIITSVSYDHMSILGNTIEKIAYEKAGIIKKHNETILYPQKFIEAERVVETICKEQDSTLIKIDVNGIEQKNYGLTGQTMDYCFDGKIYSDIHLPLIGDHQLLNAAVAIRAAVELGKLGYYINEEHIKNGISKVKWPGRFTIIYKDPLIVIDGAHNVDGVTTLSRALKKYFNDRDIIMIIGMLRDKDHRESIGILGPLAKKLIAVEPASERALSAVELAEEAKEFCSEVCTMPSISEAINKAEDIAGENSIIVICGSLYLIGEAFDIIQSNESKLQ